MRRPRWSPGRGSAGGQSGSGSRPGRAKEQHTQLRVARDHHGHGVGAQEARQRAAQQRRQGAEQQLAAARHGAPIEREHQERQGEVQALRQRRGILHLVLLGQIKAIFWPSWSYLLANSHLKSS